MRHTDDKGDVPVFWVTRGLPVLVEIGLTVFCLVQAIQAGKESVRHLPKWGWIVLILFFPLLGSIAWLIAGRPIGNRGGRDSGGRGAGRHSRPIVAPDDDADFLESLRTVDTEHEHTLIQWEEDLKRREQELRRASPPPEEPSASA